MSKSDSDDSSRETMEPGSRVNPPSLRSRLLSSSQKAKKAVTAKVPILKAMIKGAIPPIIALAFYQSDVIAHEYNTTGYLVAVISILGFCIMPRAKFFQNLAISVVASCLGAAIVLLGLWSALQARNHTAPRGVPSPLYNSSASAINAVWLFFNIFLVNCLRSAYPQFNLPTITYAIFVNVAFTYGSVFRSTAQITHFVLSLLKAFLTGLALATGVHVFVFPSNTRRSVFSAMRGLMTNFKGVLNAQSSYMASFEAEKPFELRASSSKAKSSLVKTIFLRKKQIYSSETPRTALQIETAAFKKALDALPVSFAKLFVDLPFAKREIAYGKLDADDLQELHRLLREVSLPLMGCGNILNYFERASSSQGWDQLFAGASESSKSHDDAHILARDSFEEWRDIIMALKTPCACITDAMTEAIQHVLLRLEFVPPPAAKGDVESKSQDPSPGDEAFAVYLERKFSQFRDSKHDTIKTWCRDRNISFPDDIDTKRVSSFYEKPVLGAQASDNERRRRALFLLLFVEQMLLAAAKALLDLVKFADGKVKDGTMAQKRLITPGYKRLEKWLVSIFSSGTVSDDNPETVGQPNPLSEIYLGDSLTGIQKDPEHLPPVGFWQHFGNSIRVIPRALRSKHAAFALRAAVATLSIAIAAYLKASQDFFIRQRLLWALTIVAFSMNRMSGQSTFNFVMRSIGTAIAVSVSFVVWYIVDGKTPSVLVFLFLWIAASFYVIITKPQFVIVGLLSSVSSVLIIGYELQVRKIGVEAAEVNGQPAYPIYLLAPYRLATVAGGLFVAWIWTIFPYPITEQSELRLTTGATLHAAASYYAIVHETYLVRINAEESQLGDKSIKNTPAHRLEKALARTFSRTQVLLSQSQQAANFARFNMDMGGRFPREKYMVMMELIERIILCTSLISYASRSFLEREEADPNTRVWKTAFRELTASIGPTSREITSHLAILASALSNSQPLPPHFGKVKHFQLQERLRQIDTDILSIRHIEEPGYSAFAVCQVAARGIVRNINELTELTRSLVGELDFSFSIVSKSVDASSRSESVGGDSLLQDEAEKSEKQA